MVACGCKPQLNTMTAIPPQLTEIRHQIDELDAELVRLLAKRQMLIDRVIPIKRDADLPALIQDRADQVIDRAVEQARSAGLDPELARLIWSAMVEWFIRHEERKLTK